MALTVDYVPISSLPSKTLIATGPLLGGEVVVNVATNHTVAFGDGSTLPTNWTPGVLPAVYLNQYQTFTFNLQNGDQLYAWPTGGVSSGEVKVHVMHR